ncbi:kinase-like domain-containing protein [Radiomyces spectabilis]|uniref:kinase-like domain-containing protein n=1 Tax=Radiomyces spectabilis TaxID=64574 RepID=UPI00221E6884|nr:kinase-like domain-containing protein [Radiomyces spectabilis]KAI8384957.1 kinase-like domain-containing protein [Radiomyces spectabilis]
MNSFLARCRQVTYRRQVSSSSASHGIKRTKEVGDYWLLKTIGRGSSGRVKLGIHKHTGEKVAIKMISRRHLTSSPIITRSVERELAVLQLLHHPHLIYLRQVLQDSTHVYFVMEYIEGGELYQVLSDRGRLPESEARVLFAQMVNALAWCHAHHICHRDLKPENILVDRCRNQIKIADFGMATLQCHNQLLRTSCGSPHYASPEIVKGKPYYGPATDVWSCGVILYALLTGQLPFDDENIARLLARIKTGRYRRFPDDLSHEAKDLLRRMLSVHPAKRPTMEDILLHPWLTGMQSETLPAVPRYYPYADDGPLISGPCDMDGRIWETLKVLWRDQSHEKILTALTSQG